MFQLFQQISKVIKELVNIIKGLHIATIEDSVSSLELECVELEVALLYMILGSLMGTIPIPTMLVLDLLPAMKNEFKLLESRSVKGSDVLGDLMASLGGEW
ncbi:MAG: hypothetical protein QXO98_05905 [Sulfolobales archaeon]